MGGKEFLVNDGFCERLLKQMRRTVVEGRKLLEVAEMLRDEDIRQLRIENDHDDDDDYDDDYDDDSTVLACRTDLGLIFQALTNIGNLFMEKERYGAAIPYFREVVRLSKHYADCEEWDYELMKNNINLASCFKRAKLFEQASAYCQEASYYARNDDRDYGVEDYEESDNEDYEESDNNMHPEYSDMLSEYGEQDERLEQLEITLCRARYEEKHAR